MQRREKDVRSPPIRIIIYSVMEEEQEHRMGTTRRRKVVRQRDRDRESEKGNRKQDDVGTKFLASNPIRGDNYYPNMQIICVCSSPAQNWVLLLNFLE